MSHRKLSVVVSEVRKRIDLEDWSPREEPGMPVTIRSDKGGETVLAFLKARYQNVIVKLVWEIPDMPGYSDFYFRVW